LIVSEANRAPVPDSIIAVRAKDVAMRRDFTNDSSKTTSHLATMAYPIHPDISGVGCDIEQC
jgi:hypothetical protein